MLYGLPRAYRATWEQHPTPPYSTPPPKSQLSQGSLPPPSTLPQLGLVPWPQIPSEAFLTCGFWPPCGLAERGPCGLCGSPPRTGSPACCAAPPPFTPSSQSLVQGRREARSRQLLTIHVCSKSQQHRHLPWLGRYHCICSPCVRQLSLPPAEGRGDWTLRTWASRSR